MCGGPEKVRKELLPYYEGLNLFKLLLIHIELIENGEDDEVLFALACEIGKLV